MATAPLRPAFSQSPVFRDRLLLNVPRAQATRLRDRLRELGLDTVICHDEHQSAALEFPAGSTQETILKAFARLEASAAPNHFTFPAGTADRGPALSA